MNCVLVIIKDVLSLLFFGVGQGGTNVTTCFD